MDYSLKPLGKSCYATGQPLEPGSLCYSVLIEKNGRFERIDFSPDGWDGLPDGATGVWRTRVPDAEIKAHPLQDLDQLFDLFADLVEQANDAQQKLRYVLALWLIRKKRLIHVETRDGDPHPVMVLNGAHGEGQFEIPEQELSEFEMNRLQAEIQILGQPEQRQSA